VLNLRLSSKHRVPKRPWASAPSAEKGSQYTSPRCGEELDAVTRVALLGVPQLTLLAVPEVRTKPAWGESAIQSVAGPASDGR